MKATFGHQTRAPTELINDNTVTLNIKQIKFWTDQDPILATVWRFVKQGWPKSVQPEFRPYHSRKLELSIQDDCMLWGSRNHSNAWKRTATLFTT